MLNQLTDNLSSSLVPLMGLVCLLFGLVGVIDLAVSANAEIMPALTPVLSLATIVTGLAILSYLASWWLLTRLLGVVIIISAVYSAWFAETQMSVFLPPAALLVGSVFLLSSNHNFSFRWSKFAGLLLAALSTALFISLWVRGYTTQWATNPITVTAAMIITTAVALAFLLLPSAKRQNTYPHPVGIFLAGAIVTATITIWAVVSNQHIDNIKHRGELNLRTSSETISERLVIQDAAIQRLVNRWENVGAQDLKTLIEIDSQTYIDDFGLIEAIAIFEQPNRLLPASSGADEALDIFSIESIKQWRADNFSTQAAVVVEKSLHSNQPRFVLVYPINSQDKQPKQLAVVLNISKLLDVRKIPYLDYFDTYLKLSADYYLPIASSEFYTLSEAELADLHFFQLSTELPVFGEQPMVFHAALNSPSVFWHNAMINQFILIVGLLLSVLFLATFDVNRRLNRERNKLYNLANFDTVTGLIRRDVLEQRIEDYLAKNRHLECGVLFIDLDGFKAINDNLGINIGNRLLRAVAERLKEKQLDDVEIARFSGDEFIVFLRYSSIDNCITVAERLLSRIREKFSFDELELYLTASIGISQPKLEQTTAELLIQNADVAMSKAKERGGNTFQVFTESMGVKYEHALHLRNKMQTAIEADSFEVYFQPYVAANSNKIIGAEALARWPQADGSFISPAEFIAIAEQTGQIVPLSTLIMRKAFAQLAKIQHNSDFVMSVNLSVKQFQRENITQLVSSLATEFNVPLHRLQFELTESVMVDDAQQVFTELAELRTIGCQIAIDDFGTGFSSLAYLNKLPVDVLKIDREFTQSIYTDPASQTICKAIISMAHGLNKHIIVEGIETTEQADFFKRLGCMGLQGFLFYKPMPFQQLDNLLNPSDSKASVSSFPPEKE